MAKSKAQNPNKSRTNDKLRKPEIERFYIYRFGYFRFIWILSFVIWIYIAGGYLYNEYMPIVYVYILECADKSLYTGVTNDLDRRLREHLSGKGGRYTRAKKALEVKFTEKHGSRSEAMKREKEIKTWSRKKKLALINVLDKAKKPRSQ